MQTLQCSHKFFLSGKHFPQNREIVQKYFRRSTTTTMAQEQRTLKKIKAQVQACQSLKGHADEDWCDYISEEICHGRDDIKTLNDLHNILDDQLALFSLTSQQVDQICAEIFFGLVAANILKGVVNTSAAEEPEHKGKPDFIPVSDSKIQRVFKKEIDARKRSKPEISEEILKCQHDWYHEHSGGERCMVCDFETTNTVWNCKACSINLCGSCCYKWKTKL